MIRVSGSAGWADVRARRHTPLPGPIVCAER